MALLLRAARLPIRCAPTLCASRAFSSSGGSTDTGDAPSFVVDRSGLCNVPEHSHGPVPGAPEETVMSKHIKAVIKFRGGPISVAEYMEEVLTNPNAGFYMNRDVFGSHGDFVTSPDISQMFGEMVGVWSMCLWHQMGQPKNVRLVELGPGRGTLMADLLRGTAKFTDFSETLSVHMVECSPSLKKIQKQTLKCVPKDQVVAKDVQDSGPLDEHTSQISGAPITWHIDLEQVPRGVPTIIIAHEFYDALPIHQFQRTPRGWCEKLVDVAENPGQGLRFVLSPEPTTACKVFLTRRMKWATMEEKAKIEHVEVCPQALKVTLEIAKRIGEDGGGSLIMDYGDDSIVSDSLQAIRKHEFVSVLDSPGSADLSSYVDFSAIKHTVKEAAVGSSAYGPITQSQFLGGLGINFRLKALSQNATEEQAEALQLGYWRLVGDGPAPWLDSPDGINSAPPGMGARYKVLAIVSDSYGAPIGFQ